MLTGSNKVVAADVARAALAYRRADIWLVREPVASKADVHISKIFNQSNYKKYTKYIVMKRFL
jgi:hypothetical protein